MPYVERNESGNITALFQLKRDQAEEYLEPDHPEVIAFLTDHSGAGKKVLTALAKSDGEIARVTEDLIALLMEKQIILFTELPTAVQQKLINRAKLRATLNAGDSNFLDDGESI